jgi:hypothetical protein
MCDPETLEPDTSPSLRFDARSALEAQPGGGVGQNAYVEEQRVLEDD